MAQVAAGCRQWIVSLLLMFLCFLEVNCIIDERNQVIFTQPEYTFEEDSTIESDEPLPNQISICYLYSFLDEGIFVNIQAFTTDGTATGNYAIVELHIYVCFVVLTMMFTFAGGEDFVPLSSNITQQIIFPEEMCVNVDLLGDTIFEDDEQFTLTVVVDDLSIRQQFSSNVTVTIRDNDCK